MSYKELIDHKNMEEGIIYFIDEGENMLAQGKMKGEVFGIQRDVTKKRNKETTKQMLQEAVRNSMFMVEKGGMELLKKARGGARDIPDMPKAELYPVVELKERQGKVYDF